MLYLLEQQTETHEESCWRQFISVCSVCCGIHLHEPHKETYRDSNCEASIELWYEWYHLKMLGVKNSATAWRNTWSFILWRIHINVLCAAYDSSPGKVNSDTWRVMLGTIRTSVLCVTKNSSPETTHRQGIKVRLWIIHIYGLSVARNSSPSTTQRDI